MLIEKKSDLYLLFDSHSKNSVGEYKVDGKGTVITFQLLNDVVEYLKNLFPSPDLANF